MRLDGGGGGGIIGMGSDRAGVDVKLSIIRLCARARLGLDVGFTENTPAVWPRFSGMVGLLVN
jgi:hypothetical protein